MAGSGRAGFAAGCRIGWLISHSHDYIGEMGDIYIRARGEPRVSDWVRYSRNKKVRSPNGATRSRRSHSRRPLGALLSFRRFPSYQLFVPVPRPSPSPLPPPPGELPLERIDIHGPGMYIRNASVRRIEMFDHTRDWLILYFLAAFYFRRAKRDVGMGKNKGGKRNKPYE